MGKIRTVKPELFRHEELFEVEQRSGLPLRFIFIGLFTVADREGRFRWRPRQLKLDILPYDVIDFEQALMALVEAGFIGHYEHENQYYGYIPTWKKHQSINKNEPESRLPAPAFSRVMHAHVTKNPIGSASSINVMPAYATKDKAVVDKPHDQACICTHMQQPDCAVHGIESSKQRTDQSVSSTVVIMQTVEATQKSDETANKIETISNENACLKNELQSPGHPQTATPLHPLHSSEHEAANAGICTHVQIPDAPMQYTDMPMQSTEMNMPASLEMEMEVELEEELEMEEEGSGKGEEGNRKKPSDSVQQVFEHWKLIMNHPKAVLDSQRRQAIQRMLRMGYEVEELCQAIDGCSLTPHNMGQNERGERFDGIQLIFKSADQVDRFIANANSPPRPLTSAERRIKHTLDASHAWLQEHKED